MDVQRARGAALELHIGHAVVQSPVEPLVEAHDRGNRCDVGRGKATGRGIRGGESTRELRDRQRALANAPFHEIGRGGGFGEMHQVRTRGERGRLCEHLTDTREVSRHIGFAGAELGDCEVEQRHP